MRWRWLGAVVTATAVLAIGARADAHDPIIFTPEQTGPAAGPRLPDGTISFALYGTLAGAGDARGFRATLKAGQRLELTLLVPDLAPEHGLIDAELPVLTVAAPDGTVAEHRADRRETFSESFSGTNYVRLLEVTEPVPTTGEYGITVTGRAPARFTVAIGSIERFGTPVDDVPNRDEGVAGVRRWYATPPVAVAAAAAATSTADTSTSDAPTTTVPGVATTTATVPSSVAATSTTGAASTAATPTPSTTAPPASNGGRSPTVVLGAVIILAGGAKVMLNRNRRARRNQA